jgi:membrane protein DedA with SNARE-associated domain
VEQTGQQIFDFLSQYGYWIMLPLMIIEGPVATLIAAVLASLGAFNVWVVLVFSIAGDIVGDIFLYGLGYRYGLPLTRGIVKYFGITEKLVLSMEKYFQSHGGKTIFLVKSTTGLCWATFTAAGIVRMDFKKFVKFSLLGGLVWSSFLVAMGYFYGYLWREIRDSIQWIGWVIFVLAIATVALIHLYRRGESRKIFKEF